MTIVEYFDFLPYGKHAFYIWLAYLISFLVIISLFINSRITHIRTIKQLLLKYLREDDKKTK